MNVFELANMKQNEPLTGRPNCSLGTGRSGFKEDRLFTTLERVNQFIYKVTTMIMIRSFKFLLIWQGKAYIFRDDILVEDMTRYKLT